MIQRSATVSLAVVDLCQTEVSGSSKMEEVVGHLYIRLQRFVRAAQCILELGPDEPLIFMDIEGRHPGCRHVYPRPEAGLVQCIKRRLRPSPDQCYFGNNSAAQVGHELRRECGTGAPLQFSGMAQSNGGLA